jgi:hypothetical protein
VPTSTLRYAALNSTNRNYALDLTTPVATYSGDFIGQMAISSLIDKVAFQTTQDVIDTRPTQIKTARLSDGGGLATLKSYAFTDTFGNPVEPNVLSNIIITPGSSFRVLAGMIAFFQGLPGGAFPIARTWIAVITSSGVETRIVQTFGASSTQNIVYLTYDTPTQNIYFVNFDQGTSIFTIQRVKLDGSGLTTIVMMDSTTAAARIDTISIDETGRRLFYRVCGFGPPWGAPGSEIRELDISGANAFDRVILPREKNPDSNVGMSFHFYTGFGLNPNEQWIY